MSIIMSILEGFEDISGWIIMALGQVTELFFTVEPTTNVVTITPLGGLSIIGLGVSVVMLLINMVSDFMHWRR